MKKTFLIALVGLACSLLIASCSGDKHQNRQNPQITNGQCQGPNQCPNQGPQPAGPQGGPCCPPPCGQGGPQGGPNAPQGCPQNQQCCPGGPNGGPACGFPDGEKSEECKADFEKWRNFDSLPVSEQKQLIAKRKANIDKAEAERLKAQTEFEQKWANFDNLSIAEQKQLLEQKCFMMRPSFNAPCGPNKHWKNGNKHHGKHPREKGDKEKSHQKKQKQ